MAFFKKKDSDENEIPEPIIIREETEEDDYEEPKKKIPVKLILFLFVLVLVAGLVMAYMLFKVEYVQVKGTDLYTSEQVAAISGINAGDNLFMVSESMVRNNLIESFNYIEDVKLERKIPSTIVINIIEGGIRFSVPDNGQYAYVSKTGKILEYNSAPSNGTVVLKAGTFGEVDEMLLFNNENAQAIYKEINSIMNERDSKITEIDLSDVYSIEVIYDNRVLLSLGSMNDLRYKLNFGLKIVEGDGIDVDEYGILDLSLAADNNKAYFAPTSAEEIHSKTDAITAIPEWTETFDGAGRVVDGVDIVKAKEDQEEARKKAEEAKKNGTEANRNNGEVKNPYDRSEDDVYVPTVRGDDIPAIPQTDYYQTEDDYSDDSSYENDENSVPEEPSVNWGDDIPDN